MKHFVELTQTDAYGADAPGEPFALLAEKIISYAAHVVDMGDRKITGTMILFSGSNGEMNSSFVAEPYATADRRIHEALIKDKDSRYEVSMAVVTDVVDILAAAAEKWGPVIKAKLNEQ